MAIDRSIPLADQGPFDVLLHKVSVLVMHHVFHEIWKYNVNFAVSR